MATFEVSYVVEDKPPGSFPMTVKTLKAEIKDYFGNAVKKVVVKKIS
jgi:hypothetical protein